MRGIPKNILRSSQYCQTVTILTRRVGGWGKCGTRVRYSACSPPAQYRSPKWKTKAKSSREEPESSEFSIGKAASLHATCSTPSSKTTESLLLLQCHSSNTYRRRQCHYYPRRTTNVKSRANSSTSCRCHQHTAASDRVEGQTAPPRSRQQFPVQHESLPYVAIQQLNISARPRLFWGV